MEEMRDNDQGPARARCRCQMRVFFSSAAPAKKYRAREQPFMQGQLQRVTIGIPVYNGAATCAAALAAYMLDGADLSHFGLGDQLREL